MEINLILIELYVPLQAHTSRVFLLAGVALLRIHSFIRLLVMSVCSTSSNGTIPKAECCITVSDVADIVFKGDFSIRQAFTNIINQHEWRNGTEPRYTPKQAVDRFQSAWEKGESKLISIAAYPNWRSELESSVDWIRMQRTKRARDAEDLAIEYDKKRLARCSVFMNQELTHDMARFRETLTAMLSRIDLYHVIFKGQPDEFNTYKEAKRLETALLKVRELTRFWWTA